MISVILIGDLLGCAAEEPLADSVPTSTTNSIIRSRRRRRGEPTHGPFSGHLFQSGTRDAPKWEPLLGFALVAPERAEPKALKNRRVCLPQLPFGHIQDYGHGRAIRRT